MNKYILYAVLVTYNVNAADNPISQMLEIYARQPVVVIVQPNNQFLPVIQPPLVTRGNPNLGEVDFMMPEARQTDRVNLLSNEE